LKEKLMEYSAIDVDAEVKAMVEAVERGEARPASKRESMAVRLAALSEIVREMQAAIKNDKDLIKA
jgi:hypothetical protein